MFISRYTYLVIILLSLPAVRYLFVDGYFGVSDDLHIGWLFEMDRVVRSLQFPPRFVPDLSFGFGYPLFTFVYPLPFYVAEIFHLVGFSLVNSIKLVFGLSIPLSMVFAYKLFRIYMKEDFSLAGAVLYVYAPYRALELFVRGTIGEIVAFIFFPLILMSYIKLTSEKRSLKWLGIAGLGTAGLILSHNIMAYMFTPFLLVFIAMRIYWLVKDKRYAILSSFKGLIIGLLISSYFWVPAIFESRLMKYDTVFNFYDHYPTLKQFITPYWGYGASVPGPYDTMSFYVGLVGLVTIALGTILFFIKNKKFSKSEKVFIGWSFFVVLVSVFMMNHRSAFLWRSIPLLPYFQFPWRFLAMITLVSPIFIIVLSKFKSLRFLPIVIIAGAIVFNFNYFKTSEYLGRTDDYYINRFIPYPTASEEYKKTGEEYLRLPKENEIRPNKNYPRAYTESEEVELTIQELNALDASITTSSQIDFVLNYSKYNYPGWIADIDGQRVNILSGKPYGQISFLVPSGEHIVEIKYRESPTRLVFDIVSLMALGVSIYLIYKK
ncbi:MAG: glycosyltransferase family 39 protein [bacterium]|nr:MAG: glycosyltransferase family 39 protein [bacterium]